MITRTAILATSAVALWAAAGAAAQKGPDPVSATLRGTGETPAVSTPAEGTFGADIDDVGRAVDWSLTYWGLQAPVAQAHIHFAQPGVAGGIVVWLCKTTQPNAPPGTQDCPASGTISGTFRPADVQAVTTQGIAAGDFDEIVWALRNGFAYANVHTSGSPTGEIRGQILRGGGH